MHAPRAMLLSPAGERIIQWDAPRPIPWGAAWEQPFATFSWPEAAGIQIDKTL